MLDKVIADENPTAVSGISDQLSKFASAIEKLDKKANIVDAIEVFLSFSRWLQHRQQIDSELSPELVKAFNKYQDIYITENVKI
jgi:hypothetical protein